MEKAGKIGDAKVQLLTTQLHSAASVLADVIAPAETNMTRASSVRCKVTNRSPVSGLSDTLLLWIPQLAAQLHIAEIVEPTPSTWWPRSSLRQAH
jgi:hypothetical protein